MNTFFFGLFVGILITGVIFTYIVCKEEAEKPSVKEMRERIFEVENENKSLKDQIKKLKEALRKT